MSKRLILILALAFVAGLTSASYAEVQNVKVSGDITIEGVARDNLDLAKEHVGGSTVSTTTYQDETSDIFTITRLRVDSDLTDNVSASVRLLSERTWNGDATTGTNNNINIGLATGNTAANENDIDLDLAYVTVKEFLSSPVTLALGRQELRFGNGWIVGDPDTNGAALGSTLAAGDLSARKSFDALRATLDYNPLMVDLVYAKVQEGDNRLNDDVTLSGLNAAYELNKSTLLEGFFFSKVKGTSAAVATNVDAGNATSYDTASGDVFKDKADRVHTVGARVVNRSINNLTLDVQGAYQFGTYNPKFDPNARFVNANNKALTSDRSAWGAQVVATYDLKDVDLLAKYSPTITGIYSYLSGEGRDKVGAKTYHGWDPMFEDQTLGHLINAIMGFSNSHFAGIVTTAKLKDDLMLRLDYVGSWFVKRYPEGRNTILSGVSTARQFVMTKNPFVGQEIDVNLTYNYTEDVQFSLLGGVFMPGKAINERNGTANPNRASASEIIGSMKVTF